MDGRYKIMEPTVGRANQQSEVATANGINLPWIAYNDLARFGTVWASPASRPVRWILEPADLRSGLHQVKQGTLTWTDWIRSYRGPKYFALFSWRDPAPLLAILGQALWRRLERVIFKRLLRGGRGGNDDRSGS